MNVVTYSNHYLLCRSIIKPIIRSGLQTLLLLLMLMLSAIVSNFKLWFLLSFIYSLILNFLSQAWNIIESIIVSLKRPATSLKSHTVKSRVLNALLFVHIDVLLLMTTVWVNTLAILATLSKNISTLAAFRRFLQVVLGSYVVLVKVVLLFFERCGWLVFAPWLAADLLRLGLKCGRCWPIKLTMCRCTNTWLTG